MIERIEYVSVIIIIILILCQPGFTAETFKVPYSEKIDVTRSDKVFDVDGVAITVSMSRPARAFKKIRFTIKFKKEGVLFFPQSALLRFNMKMDMGDYHAELKREDDTYFADNIILPKCMSGGKRWYGKLYFTTAGKEHSMVFIFDLQ